VTSPALDERIFSAAFREAVDLVDQGIVRAEDVGCWHAARYGWMPVL